MSLDPTSQQQPKPAIKTPMGHDPTIRFLSSHNRSPQINITGTSQFQTTIGHENSNPKSGKSNTKTTNSYYWNQGKRFTYQNVFPFAWKQRKLRDPTTELAGVGLRSTAPGAAHSTTMVAQPPCSLSYHSLPENPLNSLGFSRFTLSLFR